MRARHEAGLRQVHRAVRLSAAPYNLLVWNYTIFCSAPAALYTFTNEPLHGRSYNVPLLTNLVEPWGKSVSSTSSRSAV